MLPEKRLPMRKTREILRLHFESQLSPRQIASICSVGKGTVRRYLERLKAAGLSWPLPAALDDVELERRLFPPPPVASPEERCLPDYAAIHRELKSRKNVTLQLLWEEYKQANPLGYAYSWYCELYRAWQHRLDVVMRQEHRAGEKTFVDYAGQTVPVTDPKSGEIRQAAVFVAVLGASSYTYAEATWSQNLWDWIHSHVRAFEFFGGTSRLVIPDNLKSGVKNPCYYEPELNRTYGDLAIHYGVGILPARPYRPRDKAKVEVGVQIVQRWVLAALRKRQFFSLAEVNVAILELVHKLNDRPFRKLAGSRAELYRNIDRPALQPLPLGPFEFAEWKKARVNRIITSSLAATTTARRINWWARRSRRAARKRRWRSSIKASGLPVTYAAAGRIAPAPTPSTVPSRTSSIWSGRLRASSNGRARLVPSRHGWWRASWPASRIRRWGTARHWG